MSDPTAVPVRRLRLDAHQHFWRYDATQYPWIAVGSPLERDWLPGDLARLQEPLGFDGSIAVQARQTLAESDWLLGLADVEARIRGVVGWVDLQSAWVERDLERLARHPKFVGVRHVAQDEPDDAFLLRPAVRRGLRSLRRFDLTYDLLIYPRQLPAAIELVRHLPDQPFVLDHLAKPPIRARQRSPWREQMRELAAHPNVWCKVSGLVTEADWHGWKSDDFRPYLDVTLEAFGAERVMFGSDWPVCLLAGTYERVVGLVREYVAPQSPAMQARIFGGNCAEFYFGG